MVNCYFIKSNNHPIKLGDKIFNSECTILPENIKIYCGTSLVVQWLRIHLPTQGTQAWSLVWQDPTCHRASKPLSCNYWSPSISCAPQQEKSEYPLLSRVRESRLAAMKTQCSQTQIFFKKIIYWEINTKWILIQLSNTDNVSTAY